MHNKLLTIMIPVYNGEKHIGALLESFAVFATRSELVGDFLESCEILVVNNKSEDATLEIANRFVERLSNLRIVTPDVHKPSAEQNVFRAFPLAQGEYTWVLGVDEIVRFEAFSELLQVAREGRYEIVIFNYMVSDEHGHIERMGNFFMKGRYECTLIQLTQRMGYWWMVAGFSGQIIRTARVVGYDHDGLIAKTSAIYSHVTSYLECLGNLPAALVNIQNVIYRVARVDTGYWPKIAKRFAVFDEYFWTLGFVRQVAYLERKGIVRSDYLVKMIDMDRTRFFRLTGVIYQKILNQVMRMRSEPEARNQVSREEFDELIRYFELRDFLARPFLQAVRRVFDSVVAKGNAAYAHIDEAEQLLFSYQSNYLLNAGFHSIYGDYEIYGLADRYYGVHRLYRDALLERLRYLDSLEFVPIVVEATSPQDVVARISEIDIGMNLELVPESGRRFYSQNAYSPLTKVSSTGDIQIASDDEVVAGVQNRLRQVYKSDEGFVVRFAAWIAASMLKTARKILSIAQKKRK